MTTPTQPPVAPVDQGPAEPNKPAGAATPVPEPTTSAARRLANSAAAATELHQHWNAWSAGLGKFALQAAFALMAANWAIHGGNQSGILANRWAKASMTAGFVYLTLLLILIGLHVYLLRKRHGYADSDRVRWQKEFDEESTRKGTAWPYTWGIELNGDVMLWLHFLAPLVMGCTLLISVFFGSPPADAKTVGTLVGAPSPSTSAPIISPVPAPSAAMSSPRAAGQKE